MSAFQKAVDKLNKKLKKEGDDLDMGEAMMSFGNLRYKDFVKEYKKLSLKIHPDKLEVGSKYHPKLYSYVNNWKDRDIAFDEVIIDNEEDEEDEEDKYTNDNERKRDLKDIVDDFEDLYNQVADLTNDNKFISAIKGKLSPNKFKILIKKKGVLDTIQMLYDMYIERYYDFFKKDGFNFNKKYFNKMFNHIKDLLYLINGKIPNRFDKLYPFKYLVDRVNSLLEAYKMEGYTEQKSDDEDEFSLIKTEKTSEPEEEGFSISSFIKMMNKPEEEEDKPKLLLDPIKIEKEKKKKKKIKIIVNEPKEKKKKKKKIKIIVNEPEEEKKKKVIKAKTEDDFIFDIPKVKGEPKQKGCEICETEFLATSASNHKKSKSHLRKLKEFFGN